MVGIMQSSPSDEGELFVWLPLLRGLFFFGGDIFE